MTRQAGYGIFAHSRPDKSRLRGILPLDFIYAYCRNIGKINPLKYHILPLIFLLVTCHLSLVTAVNADTKPNRIISLAPSTTEILFALGLEDRIVGVTSFCDYPEGAKKKPKVGGMSNPSLEVVVSLRPDIVVLTTDGNPNEFEERLRSLKIKTYVYKAKQISELSQGIRELGLALGVKDKADKLVEEMEEAINRFRDEGRKRRDERRETSKDKNSSLVTRHSSLKKVLFIIWPEPLIVAGPGSIADDAISILGGENIAAKTKTAYPKYSIEEILTRAPDVIFIGKGHKEMQKVSEGLLNRLKNVPAVKNKKVVYVSDYLYRLGPRTVKGIEEIAGYMEQ